MSLARRSRAWAEDRRGGRGVEEERGLRAGGGRPALEEREIPGAAHPRAASRSAAAFPLARGESSLV